MRLTYEMDATPELVEVGGRRGKLPRYFSARQAAVGDRPEVTLTIEVRDGHPGCSCFSVDVVEGKPLLSARDLAQLSLPRLLEQAIKDNLWEVDGEWMDPRPSSDLVAEVVRSGHRRRNVIDEGHLELVAAAHRDGGTAEVGRRFRKSRSQAYRLVARARGVGLID